MQRPVLFSIDGLFGIKDVKVDIPENALILVGPNGIGKSTVSNIFYFFLSRQWQRLVEYDFSRISIVFEDGEEISARRDEITGLINLDAALSRLPTSSRFRAHVELLRGAGLLERFVSEKPSSALRNQAAAVLDVSVRDVMMIRSTIMRRLMVDDDTGLFETAHQNVEKRIAEHFTGRIIYLPTYRRIERDIQEIFPDFEERVRDVGYRTSPFANRSAKHFVDLVSFGMEDVRRNIKSRLNSLRDYSLAQFNALSGLYLRDVIRGNAQEFSVRQISELNEGSLSTILSRVSEEILPLEDKALLREKILKVSSRSAGPFEAVDSYLAHYFTLLMNVSTDISAQERDIISFVKVCNAYLEPSKEIVYDDAKFEIAIVDETGRSIDLSMLSSGEKQVVSLFSHLYLDESNDQIVIIDEPELSLSVPWQKRFLPDILESPYCSFVLAVTHSPFIYQNHLIDAAVDLRAHTTIS